MILGLQNDGISMNWLDLHNVERQHDLKNELESTWQERIVVYLKVTSI
jgi:hypothetical protein